MLKKPNESEYAEFQQKYIKSTPEDIIPYLSTQIETLSSYLSGLSESDLTHRYDEGKWSIREVIMHLIDTEIIFNYRALSTSRNEPQTLLGFDQDIYVDTEAMKGLDKDYLNEHFQNTRKASLSLFKGFTETQWQNVGKMSNYTMTLRSIPYMHAGHFDHHMRILKERYTI